MYIYTHTHTHTHTHIYMYIYIYIYIRTGNVPLPLVSRQGNSVKIKDLEKIELDSASHVMVLATNEQRQQVHDSSSGPEPDKELWRLIRTKTALLSDMRAGTEDAKDKCAAILSLPRSETWKELESQFGIYEDQEFVGELMTLCSQPQGHGLALLYNEVLQTNGGHHFMYTEHPMSISAPFLVGKPYGKAMMHYPNAVVCGLVNADGSTVMLPPHDTVIQPGHRIIAMAQNRKALFAWRFVQPRPKTPQAVEREKIMVNAARGAKDYVRDQALAKEAQRLGKKILVINWNERATRTLEEIRQRTPKGVTLSVLTDKDTAELGYTREYPLPRGTPVKFLQGDSLDQRHLVQAGALDAECIVIMSDSDTSSNVDHASDSDVFAQVKTLGALDWKEDQQRPRIVTTVYSQEAYNAIELLCEQLNFPHDLILADKIESGTLVQM